MAKSYVKFSVSGDVVSKTYEALQLAKQSGTVKKGANEVTKSVERGLASFVVIAEDVEPEEVVVHIPKICEQKKIAFSYIPDKLELGKAIGMTVPCTAVAVENQGGASNMIKDIVSKVSGKGGGAPEKKEAAPVQEKKAAAPKKEAKEAKEAAPKEQKQQAKE